MTDPGTDYTLWGFHPAYGAVPIALTGGSYKHCRAELRRREADGGWKLALHVRGTQPVGLRLIAAAA